MSAQAARLTAAFEQVARTTMRGLPVLNPALAVEAVGFARHSDAAGELGELGVLVTPWFMNLIWLPVDLVDVAPAVGESRVRVIGGERLAFIGAHVASVGPYSGCSLFSPMFEFADAAAARATAEAVLATLRAVPVPVPASPARRGFLLGRGATA